MQADGLNSKVKAGENGGRRLQNEIRWTERRATRFIRPALTSWPRRSVPGLTRKQATTLSDCKASAEP